MLKVNLKGGDMVFAVSEAVLDELPQKRRYRELRVRKMSAITIGFLSRKAGTPGLTLEQDLRRKAEAHVRHEMGPIASFFLASLISAVVRLIVEWWFITYMKE